MKTNRKLSLALLSGLTALLLFAPASFAASPPQPSPPGTTPLNLTLSGVITNAGSQHYHVQGGQLVYGLLEGIPLAPTSQVNFNVDAQVNGLATSGHATLQVSSGPGPKNQNLTADIKITGEIAAGQFPLFCAGSSCTSQIPFFFTGVANVHFQGGGHPAAPQQIPIAIESAYWNPFGGPILITSLDSPTSPSILLVVTYRSATIDWSQVQLQGTVSGTFGSNTESGYYTTVTNSHEDLFAGTERDSGQMIFAGMTDSQLNGQGRLNGNTVIPAITPSNSFDCAVPNPIFYVPGLPDGVCTSTGASSSGTFHMDMGHGDRIDGSYATVWLGPALNLSGPSLVTATTVTAQVTQH
jgi:hypothetical protein